MAKKRLDVAVTEQGLAESRQKAQAIIMAGQVYVNGQKVDKAGAPVKEDDKIEVRGKQLRYVSRGGLKLEKAMACWPITLDGAVCADIGASTGGFTDCMLQNGAAKVYAVDVGYNQLDWRLRTHPQGINYDCKNSFIFFHATPPFFPVFILPFFFPSFNRQERRFHPKKGKELLYYLSPSITVRSSSMIFGVPARKPSPYSTAIPPASRIISCAAA